MPSERARLLNEALHDLFTNEARWEVMDAALSEAYDEGKRDGWKAGYAQAGRAMPATPEPEDVGGWGV